MSKTTYGTGSSVMMNIGTSFKESRYGLATSLAWGIDGVVNYVLEGNINYTGAVITWLKDDLKLLSELGELEPAAADANPIDTTVLAVSYTHLDVYKRQFEPYSGSFRSPVNVMVFSYKEVISN